MERLDVDHLGFKGFICILGVILEQLQGYISMQVLLFFMHYCCCCSGFVQFIESTPIAEILDKDEDRSIQVWKKDLQPATLPNKTCLVLQQ